MWVNSVVVYTGTVTADTTSNPRPSCSWAPTKTRSRTWPTIAACPRASSQALFGDRRPMWKNLHENDAQKLVFFPVDNSQGTPSLIYTICPVIGTLISQ